MNGTFHQPPRYPELKVAQLYQCRFCLLPQIFYNFHDDKGNKSSGFKCSRCRGVNNITDRPEVQGHPDGCQCELCRAEIVFRTPLKTCTRCGRLLLIGDSFSFDADGGPYCEECFK